MKIIFYWILTAGAALALETAVETNKVSIASTLEATGVTNDVKAVEAMAVVEAGEATEAEEVAETVRREDEKADVKPLKSIDPWDDFMPPPDSKFDWIQLTSGEWLKGDFKVLYDYKLEFDSDELDLLEFDFEDVKRMRTRGMKTLFIEGDGGRRDTSILRGMLEINEDQVVLRRSEHEVVIPRDNVISIADGRQR